MNILGIDTSTDNCSVGLVRDGVVVKKKSERGRSMASERLVSLIDEVIVEMIPFDQIDAIAVSIGPGSYTGLRIGLSTAKGLALPGQLPVLPVPTMAVLESVARRDIDSDIVLLIKSHRDLAYHIRSNRECFLDLKAMTINYNSFSEIFEKYKDISTFVSPSIIELPTGEQVHTIYPEGDHVALLAHRHYEQLIFLSKSDLEPLYFSEFEAKKWTPQPQSG